MIGLFEHVNGVKGTELRELKWLPFRLNLLIGYNDVKQRTKIGTTRQGIVSSRVYYFSVGATIADGEARDQRAGA